MKRQPRRRPTRVWWVAVLFVSAVVSSSSASAGSANPAQAEVRADAAPCKKMGRRDTVTLDFNDAPLRDVARLVSCLRDVNLMFVPSAVGSRRVSVVSSRPVDRDAVWTLFLSMLHQHKLRTQRRGSFYAILPQ